MVDEMGEDGSLPAVAPSVRGCAWEGSRGRSFLAKMLGGGGAGSMWEEKGSLHICREGEGSMKVLGMEVV
jgi:hypothetical protein